MVLSFETVMVFDWLTYPSLVNDTLTLPVRIFLEQGVSQSVLPSTLTKAPGGVLLNDITAADGPSSTSKVLAFGGAESSVVSTTLSRGANKRSAANRTGFSMDSMFRAEAVWVPKSLPDVVSYNRNDSFKLRPKPMMPPVTTN